MKVRVMAARARVVDPYFWETVRGENASDRGCKEVRPFIHRRRLQCLLGAGRIVGGTLETFAGSWLRGLPTTWGSCDQANARGGDIHHVDADCQRDRRWTRNR